MIINTLTDIFEIVTPSDKAFQERFETYREKHPDTYMQFFINECKKCDGVIFLAFPDDIKAKGVPQVPNRIGAGVALEVGSFWKRKKYFSWFIKFNKTGLFTRHEVSSWDNFTVLTIEQTKSLLKVMNPSYE